MSRRPYGLLLFGCVLLSACAHTPLWRHDQAVEITAPADMAAVAAPVHLSWTVHTRPSGVDRFAVFVDRVPVHPGQSLRAIVGDDRSCKRLPGCPSAAYLATHGVYLTDTPDVTIAAVRRLGGIGGKDKPEVHKAVVILVNAANERVGEYAYAVHFRVPESA